MNAAMPLALAIGLWVGQLSAAVAGGELPRTAERAAGPPGSPAPRAPAQKAVAAKAGASDAPVRTAAGWTYTYDADGNRVKSVAPNGRITTTTYDALNRPYLTTYEGAGPGEIASTARYYDGNGNLVRINETRDGQVRVEVRRYDPFDRLEYVKDLYGRELTYRYDDVGNRTHLVDHDGQETVWSYNALNRNTRVYISAYGTVVQDFTPGGRLKSIVRPDGTTTEATYDDAGRLARIEHTKAGAMLALYVYRYDFNGNRIEQRETNGEGEQITRYRYDAADRRTSVALPGGVTQKLTYDPSGSLSGIDYRTAAGSIGTLTYGYDAAGRRTSVGGTFARVSLPALTSASTYNAVNALTSRGGTSYTYDAEGQLTGDGTRTYAWNARHQLTGVTGGGTTAAFTYDPLGRRLTRTVGATSTGFVYDDENLVQEKQGATVTANLLTGFRTDETFARSEAAGTRSLLTDALGSTVALTSSTGAVATSYTYDPYGVSSSTGATSTNAMQFTGRENDGTGLTYQRARYYSPGLQRFLSQDPAGEQGSGTNLYGYVDQSPTNFTDPSGKFVNLLIGCAVGAAFGVGTGWLMSSLTGDKYTLKQGLIDAGLGCAGGALMGWLRPAATVANEGIYVVRTAAGDYVGQSGNISQRMAQHVASGKFTQAEVDAAERIAVQGGKTAREIAEQLKIDSMGGIQNLLNKVNPIGQARLHLMPPGYIR